MKQSPAQTIALSSLQPLSGNRPDRYVIWTVLVLMSAGVVAVYSAVSYMAMTKAGGNSELFLFRHLSHVAMALIAATVLSTIDYHWVARKVKWVLFASILLLLGVQFWGLIFGGAARWIEILGVRFQPSEFARVALIVHLAHLLAKKQAYVTDLRRSFLPIMFWTALTILLIGKSDLSTGAMLFGTVMLMCIVGRIKFQHIAMVAVILFVAAGSLLMSSPERAARIEAWLDVKIFPHTSAEDVFSAQGERYQADQAQIAIAQGGLLGVGPGKSVQRDFLPAPYNDFIFAIIAEEYGIVGALGLLTLFLVLLFRGAIRIARDAPDDEGLFLGVGITAMISLYAFVHAGVSCGLLPVTGLPMPFVSYGGTSLLASGILIGILLNISRQRTLAPVSQATNRRKTK